MYGTATQLIYLFGDSLTQYGYDASGWVASLSHIYSRKLTIVNAGLSGYSTDKALATLPRILPPVDEVKLFVLFFGANDAVLPGENQHVPLEAYRENLRRMVGLVEGGRVLLVTPPPVDERLCEGDDLAKGVGRARRKAEVTAGYAQVVRALGTELGVQVLDLWSVFMERAGWRPGQPLVGAKEVEGDGLTVLLEDGVHLTAEGNQVLFRAFAEKVKTVWPDMDPDTMEFELPYWADLAAWRDLEMRK